mmetsp:Transcript_20826/g.62250  ORF Transcript_20826/g.62250 Transcript_20826/m.62250 type:complete len:204 (+) Transcript_20826:772-1383(+)
MRVAYSSLTLSSSLSRSIGKPAHDTSLARPVRWMMPTASSTLNASYTRRRMFFSSPCASGRSLTSSTSSSATSLYVVSFLCSIFLQTFMAKCRSPRLPPRPMIKSVPPVVVRFPLRSNAPTLALTFSVTCFVASRSRAASDVDASACAIMRATSGSALLTSAAEAPPPMLPAAPTDSRRLCSATRAAAPPCGGGARAFASVSM